MPISSTKVLRLRTLYGLRNLLAASVVCVVLVLTVLTGLASSNPYHDTPPPPPPKGCQLYPIALSAKSLVGVQTGGVIQDILNGTKPGNFGWLTWNGDLDVSTLAKSLTPPGDSFRYVNPFDSHDHEVSVGDKVLGRPGTVNASSVRAALEKLKKVDAIVPVWDVTSGSGSWSLHKATAKNTVKTAHGGSHGSKVMYRVSGFALVRLLDYRLPDTSRITVRFLGMAQCGPAQNRAPVANNGSDQTPEDTAKELTLSGSDPDGDPITFATVSSPTHGHLGPIAGNKVTYTPDPNYNGPDSFTFKANDGKADSSAATFSLTVTPVNDPPVCRDLAVQTPFATPVETSPDCSDVDGDALSYEIVSQGARGTASVVAGHLRYEPALGETGSDTFTYRANDGKTASNTATVSVTIGTPPGNQPPIARDDTIQTPEDTTGSVEALANDSDPDGDPIALVSWTQAQHGVVLCLSSGHCTYLPEPNFNGTDAFQYTIDDGHGNTAQATVHITVTPVNDTPVAHDSTAKTAEDTPGSVTLPAEDLDGDALTFSILSGPTHGTLGTIAGGVTTYTPSADFFGTDSFTFKASDGNAESQTATVVITVTEVNDPPAGKDDEFAVGVVESSPIPTPVVLVNDLAGPANETGQPLKVTDVAQTADSHGDVSLSGDVITYTPDPGFVGTATVGYTLCDGGTTDGQPDPRCASNGLVKLDVTAPDRAPIADAQQLTTQEDLSLPLTLTGSDPDGDPLTYEIVQPPLHGSLVGTAPALTYVPAADYNGPDGFAFAVSDGRLRSEAASVALTVGEVNDPPVPGGDSATVGGAGTLTPPPPRPPCRLPCGVIYGDPHLSSFDAALYDFQAVGEFIGAKSTTDDFELQARFVPVPPLLTVSIATAVAMRVAGHRVAFYRTLTGFDTRLDGAPFAVTPNPQALPGGGTIGTYGYPNEVTVVWPDGSLAIVDAVGLYQQYYRFTVELGLAAARLTHFAGLLGNADGDKTNDLVTRDGQTQLPYPNPPFNQEYPAYADSWRISQAESLFDYGPGRRPRPSPTARSRMRLPRPAGCRPRCERRRPRSAGRSA